MEETKEQWKIDLRDEFAKVLENGQSHLGNAKVGFAYLRKAPSTLFKYYPDNLERIQSVFENKMWYSAPVNFNDVFDCDSAIDRKSISKCFSDQIPEIRGLRIGSPKWKEFQGVITKVLEEMKDALNNVRETTGVTCLSESYNSDLMWGHYANSHKGICVEYELMKFNNVLGFTPVPVIYSSKRVRLDYIDCNNPTKGIGEFFIKSITTKSTDWDYEKEWRIIRDDSACGKAWEKDKKGALLPSITPKSIILGCETSSKARNIENEITLYCRDNHISLYKMEKDETEYVLKKVPVFEY